MISSEPQSQSIRVVPVKTDDQLTNALAIRQTVFVDEQNVDPDIEMDEFDATADHLLAYYEDIPVGTARYRHTAEGWKLERFAVLGNYRGRGVGETLLNYCLEILPADKTIFLNAQHGVIGFYRRYGFVPVGKTFLEADIVHQKMVLKQDRSGRP